MKLTQRDSEILSALCLQVRLFCLEQIAMAWWPGAKQPRDAARKRLAKLEDNELLVRTRVLALKLPDLAGPVLSWAPGQDEPDLGAVAWKLQKRWTPGLSSTTAYLASKKAAKLFGGRASGTLAHCYQATHDIGVAQMYLRLRQTHPEQLQYWIGEDMLAPHRRRQKLPDAVLASKPGATPTLVLEFGGAYDKVRLQAFHNDCFERSLPYEVW